MSASPIDANLTEPAAAAATSVTVNAFNQVRHGEPSPESEFITGAPTASIPPTLNNLFQVVHRPAEV
ncbi:hypothetical protein GCM10010428_23090 [Actinosynnema pretiosum subsp. pretiosum]